MYLLYQYTHTQAALNYAVTTWMQGNSLTIVLQFEQKSMLWSLSLLLSFLYFSEKYFCTLWRWKGVHWVLTLTLPLLFILIWNPEKRLNELVFFKTLLGYSQLCSRALLNTMPVKTDTPKKKTKWKWKQQSSRNSMPHCTKEKLMA